MIYCLDTDIIIEYFRGNDAVKNKIENIGENDSIGLTWLSVYEFFKGICASGKFNNEDPFNRIAGLEIENWLKI